MTGSRSTSQTASFQSQSKDYGVFSGVIELIYGKSLAQRWRGFLKLLGRKP